jgi:hypothetical protein
MWKSKQSHQKQGKRREKKEKTKKKRKSKLPRGTAFWNSECDGCWAGGSRRTFSKPK